MAIIASLGGIIRPGSMGMISALSWIEFRTRHPFEMAQKYHGFL